MSSFRKIQITCPDCNNEGGYTIWDSVNVDLNPEMRSKVMDGSLFSWTCPNCKKTFNAPYPFLYHDMTHNFMVQFDPERSHIIPFAEFIRVKENDLDMSAIYAIAASYRNNNPKKNILFDCLTEDKQLMFTILEMPNDIWEFTDQKHSVPFDEYLSVCNELEKQQSKM